MWLPNDEDPEHTAKLVTKRLKNIKVDVLEWPLEKPWFCRTHTRAKTVRKAGRPRNLTAPVLSGGMGQNSEQVL